MQLEAIKQTKVNMSAWLAVYNVPDNATAYEEQAEKVIDALKTYGADHVGGVTVGNEFILKCVFGLIPMSCCGLGRSGEVLTGRGFSYIGAHGGGDDPNSAVGDAGAALLNANITDMKNQISNLGLTIPVGTSDAGAYFNNEVLENVDFAVRLPYCCPSDLADRPGPLYSLRTSTRGSRTCRSTTRRAGRTLSSRKKTLLPRRSSRTSLTLRLARLAGLRWVPRIRRSFMAVVHLYAHAELNDRGCGERRPVGRL